MIAPGWSRFSGTTAGVTTAVELQAVEEDVVTILKADLKLLERLTQFFRIDT